jgi:hypothetical protein
MARRNTESQQEGAFRAMIAHLSRQAQAAEGARSPGDVASHGSTMDELAGADTASTAGPIPAAFVVLSRFAVANGMEEEEVKKVMGRETCIREFAVVCE